MKREDVEKAAKEDVLVQDEFEDYAVEVLVDFAIQQVNAALEEAAKFIELPAGLPIVMDMDGLDLLAEGVRTLKIP